MRVIRPPSNASLLKISAFTGIMTIGGISYIQWSLQRRLRESPYCKLAMETLAEHRGASKLLGETITNLGYNLGDSEHNYCNGSQAEYQVNVKGSKAQGKMYLWATRKNDQEDWRLDRLELEVNSQPNKRFILKKSQEANTSDQKIDEGGN